MAHVAPQFVERLDALRERLGAPLIVSSGYRCQAHNARVSSSGRFGPHTTGRAADLAVSGAVAFRVLALAAELGFTGLGVQQRGAGRFVHLDDLPAASDRPRPWVWSY